MSRAFLVARQGTGAAIREVAPGTNAHEFTREGAWEMAVKMSTKLTKKSKERKALGPIRFISLDGQIMTIPTEKQVA